MEDAFGNGRYAMSGRASSRWFSDDGENLDRFGLVLGLAAASVAILSLIDIDEATVDLRSQIGWVLVTVTVGLTLVVSLRASGVARRPRRVAEIVVAVAVVSSVAVVAIGLFVDLTSVLDVSMGRPSPLWAVIAMVSPVVVLRRVMLQRVVSRETMFGAVAVYLLLSLAFNYVFLSLDGGPGFFGHVESTSSFMYFSLVTITTLGYGDLTPVSDLGRFMATSEAILGQVLLVTVVARLVTMYSNDTGPATAVGKSDADEAVE